MLEGTASYWPVSILLKNPHYKTKKEPNKNQKFDSRSEFLLKVSEVKQLSAVLIGKSWHEQSLKISSKSGAVSLSYKLLKLATAYPFLKKLGARL